MMQDVRLIPPKANSDDRGYLIVLGSSGREDAPEIPTIKEVYVVGDMARGTIRAFHKHENLWDYISRGSAKFVLIDDRQDRGTKGRMSTFVLTELSP